METVGAIPAALLRSLQRLSPSDEQEDASAYDVLTRGAILGVYTQLPSSDSDIPIIPRLVILGLLRQAADTEIAGNLADYVPTGISTLGSFAVVRGASSEDEEAVEAVALQVATEKENMLVYELTTKTASLYHCEEGKATKLELEEMSGLHARDFHRAVGVAPLRCAVDIYATEKTTLLKLLRKYQAATKDEKDFFVRVGGTMKSKNSGGFRVLNGRGEDVLKPDAEPLLLESLLPEDEDESTDTMSKKKSSKKQKKSTAKKTASQQNDGDQSEDAPRFLPSLEYGDIANVDLLVSLAPMEGAAEVAAPVVTIPPPSGPKFVRRHFRAHCDALVIVPVNASLQSILPLLRQQLYTQLTTLSKRLEHADESVSSVAAHQFPLVGAAFPLTLISTSNGDDDTNDDSMEDDEFLERLHRAFFQSVQQPLFRESRGCSLAQQGEWLAASDVLYNVHEGVPGSSVSAQGQRCIQALVDGFYGYYHYMQQNTNDKGWGCAYRSLQTLASWLFVQHYTQQRFLSHEQIQRALVQMGDKPARFQGSTEWIGSLEVGYVLDELFGVTFRSLSVSSGAQLPDVARELLHHFETQGTPVMMGGGQLAFTLLGVDYDPDSGACAFLTLDPHYTGDEDLATIQQQTVALEGYKAVPCSWRKTTSFAKNSFYNLCLPQRPTVGV